MHAMMTFVSRGSGGSEQHLSWQDGYHDTRIRTVKQFAYVMNYIEQNPVKKGLADNPSGWKDSSATQTDLLTDPWPHFYD